LHSMKVDAA